MSFKLLIQDEDFKSLRWHIIQVQMLKDLTVTDVYVRECIDLDGDFRRHLAHFENVGVTGISPDLGRKMWWLALRKDEEVEVEKKKIQ